MKQNEKKKEREMKEELLKKEPSKRRILVSFEPISLIALVTSFLLFLPAPLSPSFTLVD
jgi:hypothetical protein